jgi:hypothetical protein
MRLSAVSRLTLLFVCCAMAAHAQNSTVDQIVLPADKTDADVTLTLPEAPLKGATVSLQPVSDADGHRLSPQPSIDGLEVSADIVQFHIANVFFWGGARLGVEVSGIKDPYIYTLQRGPIPASSRVNAERQKPALVWLYNSGTLPYTAKWRIVSGAESICGEDTNGKSSGDCASPASQPQITLAPAATGRIEFQVPDSWFSAGDSTRQAVLELRFGTSESAPVYPIPLEIHIGGVGAGVLALWFPQAVAGLAIISNLIWVTFGVTLGAVLLMLAQVMIPNFRKCLAMENQVESLEVRMRGISAAVGNRLSTRCNQEIQSLRQGLGMGRPTAKSPFTLDVVFLSGNTDEVTRVASILPKVQSRVRLTERLDERQTATLDSDTCGLPPSLCWGRQRQLHSVQSILAGQFVTDVDEKNASAILDLLADPEASLKEFRADLETRVEGIRRLYLNAQWSEKCDAVVKELGLDECAGLVSKGDETVPDGGWSMEELIRRDLAAVKLSIINQMITLWPLLNATPAVLDVVRLKLQSNDPGILADADTDLAKLAQGISDQDVVTALKEGMWDALMEPATQTVTDRDVIRMTLVFRDKRVDRSTAKNSFHCSWRILPGDYYEDDWQTQLLLPSGKVTVQPAVYDARGNELAIRPSTESEKGIVSLEVVQPPSIVRHARLLRGLLDAAITALVPVITVALTQVQNGGTLGIDKLVLLGFTSQAIRAAVVQDSVSTPPPPPPATPTALPSNAKPAAK